MSRLLVFLSSRISVLLAQGWPTNSWQQQLHNRMEADLVVVQQAGQPPLKCLAIMGVPRTS